MIIPLNDLINSIPEEVRTKEIIEKVTKAYNSQQEYMLSIVNNAFKNNGNKNVDIECSIYPFRKAGSQLIAEFEMNNRSLPQRNSYNWHGQNTSQWLYAGCILIDNNEVSIHT